MRVIFLDVDGVLNHDKCPEWATSTDALVLDPECVGRINQICDLTNAKIVVSSVWRGSQVSMAKLLEAFGDFIIGVTPFSKDINAPRRDEIQAWLVQHSAIPIECCVIDDDEDAQIPVLPFVRTSFEHGGLTEEFAERVYISLTAEP